MAICHKKKEETNIVCGYSIKIRSIASIILKSKYLIECFLFNFVHKIFYSTIFLMKLCHKLSNLNMKVGRNKIENVTG